jgi:hypothetical protein
MAMNGPLKRARSTLNGWSSAKPTCPWIGKEGTLRKALGIL